jgi:hypothetical protein
MPEGASPPRTHARSERRSASTGHTRTTSAIPEGWTSTRRGSYDPATNVTNDDPIVTGKIARAHPTNSRTTRLAKMEADAERTSRWFPPRSLERPAEALVEPVSSSPCSNPRPVRWHPSGRPQSSSQNRLEVNYRSGRCCANPLDLPNARRRRHTAGSLRAVRLVGSGGRTDHGRASDSLDRGHLPGALPKSSPT